MTIRPSVSTVDERDKSKIETTMLLSDYMQQIAPTDRLPRDNLQPVLMGLFGEVGSIMATAKKAHREQEAYVGFKQAVEEEFGDVLWYFTTLCRRLGTGVDIIVSETTDRSRYSKVVAASDLLDGPVSHISSVGELHDLDKTLLNLGEATAALLGIERMDEGTRDSLRVFSDCYLQALQAAGVSFSKIARLNIKKARERFLDPDPSKLPTFDRNYPDEERLPEHFEIKIIQRKNGRSYMQWNGVFIGDPLTDNITYPDGYRFHDVFHLANAAILHWSPTFRGLIKRKRKSNRKVDEAQDGGRAIVVEEGLSAWIFSCAKDLDFFCDQNTVSFDLLKTLQQFVRGYEVQECPLRLWEMAILEGYRVFRQVLKNDGGIVIGDRKSRTIKYRPIRGD